MRKKQSIKELKDEGLIKNASEIEPPKPFYLDLSGTYPTLEQVNKDIERSKYKIEMGWMDFWEGAIERYCVLASITPQDLISSHRELNKSNLAGKRGKELKISDVGKTEKFQKPTQSNWRKDYIEKKTGIKSKT